MTSEVPATEKPLSIEDQMDRVWKLASTVFVAAVVAVFAYGFTFRNLSIGDPAAWGQFGDYFGGVINPIVGMITVVLVIITLSTTRREAAEQRKQFQLQLDDFKRQQVLAGHQKRLEGVLADWNALMQTSITFNRGDRAGLLGRINARKLGEAFSDPTLYQYARTMDVGPEDAEVETAYDALIPITVLISEVAEYTEAYAAVSSADDVIANFYRRRVYIAAYILYRFGLIDNWTADEIGVTDDN